MVVLSSASSSSDASSSVALLLEDRCGNGPPTSAVWLLGGGVVVAMGNERLRVRGGDAISSARRGDMNLAHLRRQARDTVYTTGTRNVILQEWNGNRKYITTYIMLYIT